MAGILKKMAQKEFESAPPITLKGHCLNHKQTKPVCDICKEVCPVSARTEPGGKVKESLCRDCGLCTAVCPSRAITPSGKWARMIKSQLNKPRESYIIGCAEAEKGDIRPTYLCRMPWELFAYLALLGHVTVLTGMCEQCETSEAKPLLDASLMRTRIFLGDEEFEKRVTLVENADEAPEDPGISRREVLTRAFKGVGHTVGAALKESDKTEDPMLLRKLLLLQVQKQEEIGSFNWLTQTLTDHCWGCGVCERVCPHGAIKIYTSDEGKHYFLHYANLCTGCGACKTVCPHDAIKEFTFQPLRRERKFFATQIRAGSCAKCGGPVARDAAEGTLCSRCKVKKKTRVIMDKDGTVQIKD